MVRRNKSLYNLRTYYGAFRDESERVSEKNVEPSLCVCVTIEKPLPGEKNLLLS